MIDNLNFVKEQGMDKFLAKEAEKWKCPKCGDVICCHTQACYNCLSKPSKHNWKKIPPEKVTEADLIAPCGMNCGLCSGYLAYANNLEKKRGKIIHCTGCLPRNKQCAFIKKHCDLLINNKIRFCYECPDFPCKNLQTLDKRYRTRYNMSMIDNLEFIRDNGIDKFLRQQSKKYKCPTCDGMICIHNGKCYQCQHIGSWKE